MMKYFFLNILFGICLYVLVGCSPKNDKNIRVLGEDSSNLRAIMSLGDNYSDYHIEFRPNSFEDSQKKADNDFNNHTGLYDIILQVNFSLSNFVRNQYVAPFDTLVNLLCDSSQHSIDTADFFKNAWEEVGYYYRDPSKPLSDSNMIRIGYPFATNTMLLVYNKQMFGDEELQDKFRKEYGRELALPETWEEFRQLAQFFTDKRQETYGVCMQGNESWLYYEYCVFLFGNGGKVFDKRYGWEGDENTRIVIDSEGSLKATEFYLSMKNYNAGTYQDISCERQLEIMKKGNVAMGIVWSDYLFNLVLEGYDSLFGFAPIPGGKSPLAGGCFYVNNDSKKRKKEEAFKYIISLMRPETQKILAKNGLCSPLKSVYDDREVKACIPYAEALKESLGRGEYMFEAGPESVMVQETISKYMLRLWNSYSGDREEIKETLSLIRDEIEKDRSAIYRDIYRD